MNEKNDPNVQVIENATRGDVRPGDHLILETPRLWRDVTITTRREGIAHHRDGDGDWCTEDGVWLTDFSDASGTLTIRRPVMELPTTPRTVIVPADGHEYIEAVVSGVVWRTREAVLGLDGRWHGAWRVGSGRLAVESTSSDSITPDTWKVDEK